MKKIKKIVENIDLQSTKKEISFLTKMPIIKPHSEYECEVICEINEAEEEVILNQIGEVRIIECFPESVSRHVKNEMRELLNYVFITSNLKDMFSQDIQEIIRNFYKNKNGEI